jgi:hypothetical protein
MPPSVRNRLLIGQAAKQVEHGKGRDKEAAGEQQRGEPIHAEDDGAVLSSPPAPVKNGFVRNRRDAQTDAR